MPPSIARSTAGATSAAEATLMRASAKSTGSTRRSGAASSIDTSAPAYGMRARFQDDAVGAADRLVARIAGDLDVADGEGLAGWVFGGGGRRRSRASRMNGGSVGRKRHGVCAPSPRIRRLGVREFGTVRCARSRRPDCAGRGSW